MKHKFAMTAASIIFGIVIGLAVAHSIQIAQAFDPFDEIEFTPVEDLEEFAEGPWHVDYVPCWGSNSAPADGSIGIWADGWFIAHSGTINGKIIASAPSYIEVDSQVYVLADLWITGDSISAEEVARARANNGIVFQTCITDSENYLVHYEPVDGPGYPYDFDNFPYTKWDLILFGLQEDEN